MSLLDSVKCPTSPTTTEETGLVSTSDVDSDSVTVLYTWTVDGAPSTETSDTLSASEFSKN